jgi:carbon storage regulator
MNAICIGRDIRITVLGIRGNQVRLGIAAPKDVVVDREEVHVRKQQEATAVCAPTAGGVL